MVVKVGNFPYMQENLNISFPCAQNMQIFRHMWKISELNHHRRTDFA